MRQEQKIEHQLTQAVKNAGGLCWKFTSPGTAGVPDRIIILPPGKICFVELKAPGQQPRPIQVRRHQQLTHLGAMVRTIDNPNHIHELLHEIHTAHLPNPRH